MSRIQKPSRPVCFLHVVGWQ